MIFRKGDVVVVVVDEDEYRGKLTRVERDEEQQEYRLWAYWINPDGTQDTREQFFTTDVERIALVHRTQTKGIDGKRHSKK